jgi:hypothetical protein
MLHCSIAGPAQIELLGQRIVSAPVQIAKHLGEVDGKIVSERA